MDQGNIDFILFPDARLTAAASPRPVDAALLAIGEQLLAAAVRVNAYGLAAAHVGQVAPVAVISVGPAEGRDYRVLYNPVLISTGGAEVSGVEGSVSMPGIEVSIVRPDMARIAFDDAAGVRQELELAGFAARVAQHEIEQVAGIFFLSRLSRLKRDAAVRRFAKLQGRS